MRMCHETSPTQRKRSRLVAVPTGPGAQSNNIVTRFSDSLAGRLTLVGLSVAGGTLPDLAEIQQAVARHPELGLDTQTAAVESAATGTDAAAKASMATALNRGRRPTRSSKPTSARRRYWQARSALASTHIARQMARVEAVAFDTAGTVGQLRQAAEDFDTVAQSLSDQVGAFTTI